MSSASPTLDELFFFVCWSVRVGQVSFRGPPLTETLCLNPRVMFARGPIAEPALAGTGGLLHQKVPESARVCVGVFPDVEGARMREG
eukprot:4791996-Lingulodinium_polyedra.AAC.1